MSYKVLIPQDISSAGKDYLTSKGYVLVKGRGTSVEDICADVVDCDAILARTAPFPREVLESGKKLKVISRHGVGTDNIDLAAATEFGIQVTNAPLSNYKAVAEHTLAFILACAINVVYMDNQVKKGNWSARDRVQSTEVEGKTLGLVGLGRIGRTVAEKAYNGLQMKIIGYDPYLKSTDVPPYIELIPDRESVFRKSDFVSLHIPATKDTEKSINRDMFKQMKKSAYLINCARGEIINEADLYTALKEGWLRGAALDVMADEPPKTGNPLFTLDNLIVSPHDAAHTAETMDRMGLGAARGIDEVLSGKKPTWPVNHLK